LLLLAANILGGLILPVAEPRISLNPGANGARPEQEQMIETLIKIGSAQYDKAAAYANLIMAAAYAAFFAVWSNMKGLMSPSEMRLSALCMVVSLLVFVVWELTKMVLTSARMRGLAQLVQSPGFDFPAKLKQQQLADARFNLGVARAWPIALVASVVPGVCAGGILVWSFLSNLG
jgi:hypothetical protein